VDGESVKRVLVECRRENDANVAVDSFEQLKARQARHLNVEEEHVHGRGLQGGYGIFRIGCGSGNVHAVSALEQTFQPVDRQPFVVDDECLESTHGRSGGGCMAMRATVRPSSRVIVSVADSPHIIRNRSRNSANPWPEGSMSAENPGPSSSTCSAMVPLVLAARTRTVAPVLLGDTAYLTLFSTRVCSDMRGTATSCKPGSMSIAKRKRLPKRTRSISR